MPTKKAAPTKSQIRERQKRQLLQALSHFDRIGLACDYVGISHSTYASYRKTDPQFAQRADDIRASHAAVNPDAVDWRTAFPPDPPDGGKAELDADELFLEEDETRAFEWYRTQPFGRRTLTDGAEEYLLGDPW